MRNNIYLIPLAVCLVASCQYDNNPCCEYAGERLFETTSMQITANHTNAVLDEPIIITMRCQPMLTGKGLIGISVSGSNLQTVIDYPIQDSTRAEGYVFIPAEFAADVPFQQEWTIRFQDDYSQYFVQGRAFFDSLFVADSSRYFHLESAEVASEYGVIDYRDYSSGGLILEYPK